MKQTSKKLWSLLLALVMVLSLAPTALAAGITVSPQIGVIYTGVKDGNSTPVLVAADAPIQSVEWTILEGEEAATIRQDEIFQSIYARGILTAKDGVTKDTEVLVQATVTFTNGTSVTAKAENAVTVSTALADRNPGGSSGGNTGGNTGGSSTAGAPAISGPSSISTGKANADWVRYSVPDNYKAYYWMVDSETRGTVSMSGSVNSGTRIRAYAPGRMTLYCYTVDENGKNYVSSMSITASGATYSDQLWKPGQATNRMYFEPNGGSGEMLLNGKIAYADGSVVVIPDCYYTAPEGKEFKCWRLKEYANNENSLSLTADDDLMINSGDTTLVAIWKDKAPEPEKPATYTVTYDANGGTGTMSPATVESGKTLTLPACGFTAPTGKEFKCWEVNGKEYAPKATLTVTGNTTVKAVWQDKAPEVTTYTATFDANGGSGIMSAVSVEAGKTLTFPANKFTAPSGKEFKCWEVDGKEYAPGAALTLTGNVTVKAVWKDKETSTTDTAMIRLYTNNINKPLPNTVGLEMCFSMEVNAYTQVANASNPQIQWTVEDPSVALIANRANGNAQTAQGEIWTGGSSYLSSPGILIYPQKIGKTVISAQIYHTVLGDTMAPLSNKVYFTLEVLPTPSFTLDPASLSLNVGEEKTVTMTLKDGTFGSSSRDGWWIASDDTSCAELVPGSIKRTSDTTLTFNIKGVSNGATDMPIGLAWCRQAVKSTAKLYRIGVGTTVGEGDCTVTFNANGGSGVMNDMKVESGKYLTLPRCTFTAPAGRRFYGWRIDGRTYNVGEQVRITADTTVYAMWESVGSTYTISYTLNGGSFNRYAVYPTEYTVSNVRQTLDIDEPVREGYRFLGWTYTGMSTPTYHVTLPAGFTGRLYLTANWELAEATYAVNVSSSRNGTVTASEESAAEGARVTLTVRPSKGYELDSLTVTDRKGNDIAVREISDTQYRFTMPDSRVTVSAKFVEEAAAPAPTAPTAPAPTPTIPTAPTQPNGAPLLPLKNFADVRTTDWFHSCVDFVYQRGLMTGTSSTDFAPNDKTTRGMIWTMMARMAGQSTDGGSIWYEKGQQWAISNGVSDGTNPDRTITREEFATMLWRSKGSPASSGTLAQFSDAGKISGYAQDALRWAIAQGVMSGKGNGVLDPQGPATRAEVAQMVMNFMIATGASK